MLITTIVHSGAKSFQNTFGPLLFFPAKFDFMSWNPSVKSSQVNISSDFQRKLDKMSDGSYKWQDLSGHGTTYGCVTKLF